MAVIVLARWPRSDPIYTMKDMELMKPSMFSMVKNTRTLLLVCWRREGSQVQQKRDDRLLIRV